MESNSAPYKPCLHQPNPSSSALIARRMEVAIPPRQLPPSPFPRQFTSKELPPLPIDIPSSRYWNEITGSWETPIHREMTSSTTQLASIDTTLQSTLNRPRHTSGHLKELRTPLTPPMTKSSQKILQLTGYDPRFEKILPIQHQQINQPKPVSPAPSSSSGSVYSQPENFLDKVDIQHGESSCWSSSTSSNPGLADRGILQSSFYKFSEHMAGAISSTTSLQHKDHSTEAQTQLRPMSQSAMGQYAEMNQNEIATLQDLIAQEQERYSSRMTQGFENDLESQYRHELTDADILNLVPRPLALRPKNRIRHLSLDTKHGLLRNPRNSSEWGISEMTSVNKTKHCNTPIRPAINERSILLRKVPASLKPINKLFGTGNHPLKSPFPFDELEDVPEISPVQRQFNKRISGALEQLSGASPTSPKRTVISNKARRPSGPDTPMPHRTRFMAFLPSVETTMQRRGVHLQDVVTKAKKTVRFKSSEERKRESLKKSIVVVGISDQSPDGRVAEWL